MKMSEITTYCNPGKGWAGCWAQKYNCDVDLIEQTMSDADASNPEEWDAMKHFVSSMWVMGYKLATYCDECGSKYSG